MTIKKLRTKHKFFVFLLIMIVLFIDRINTMTLKGSKGIISFMIKIIVNDWNFFPIAPNFMQIVVNKNVSFFHLF